MSAYLYMTTNAVTGKTQGSNLEQTFRPIKSLNNQSNRTDLHIKKHQSVTHLAIFDTWKIGGLKKGAMFKNI